MKPETRAVPITATWEVRRVTARLVALVVVRVWAGERLLDESYRIVALEGAAKHLGVPER